MNKKAFLYGYGLEKQGDDFRERMKTLKKHFPKGIPREVLEKMRPFPSYGTGKKMPRKKALEMFDVGNEPSLYDPMEVLKMFGDELPPYDPMEVFGVEPSPPPKMGQDKKEKNPWPMEVFSVEPSPPPSPESPEEEEYFTDILNAVSEQNVPAKDTKVKKIIDTLVKKPPPPPDVTPDPSWLKKYWPYLAAGGAGLGAGGLGLYHLLSGDEEEEEED